MLWRAVEILILVDQILEQDSTGAVVLYADKQKLAAKVKEIILPFMIHTRSLFNDFKPDSYSKDCLIALRKRLEGIEAKNGRPEPTVLPKADDILADFG